MTEQEEDYTKSQIQKLQAGIPDLKLIKPCTIGDGIVSNPTLMLDERLTETCKWFIPASGSGSRMFQFLFDYLKTNQESNEIKRFKSSLKTFAFFQKLDAGLKMKSDSEEIEINELIHFILSEEGLNFSKSPKGMIPFHLYDYEVRNAFQEQVIQGKKIPSDHISFHFTIQNDFKTEINQAISLVNKEGNIEIDFSEQFKSTDSVAFNEKLEPFVLQNGQVLKRPAGHGSLIENLNQIESDFILVKNIDNIQHELKSEKSIEEWTKLLLVAKYIRQKLQSIWKNPNLNDLEILNKEYHIFDSKFLASLSSEEEIRSILNRPLRVCGMVKNIGQPGGGPFWVEKNGVVSKQIVEKAQISLDEKQQQILVESTHFNPVMLVAATKDFEGNKFDLMNYIDEETYFIVYKTHEGKAIQYIERPGLWNGAMANWNTVFVEVPSEVFSPVKTLLDLLDESHV